LAFVAEFPPNEIVGPLMGFSEQRKGTTCVSGFSCLIGNSIRRGTPDAQSGGDFDLRDDVTAVQSPPGVADFPYDSRIADTRQSF
jgi:hypothetical protein